MCFSALKTAHGSSRPLKVATPPFRVAPNYASGCVWWCGKALTRRRKQTMSSRFLRPQSESIVRLSQSETPAFQITTGTLDSGADLGPTSRGATASKLRLTWNWSSGVPSANSRLPTELRRNRSPIGCRFRLRPCAWEPRLRPCSLTRENLPQREQVASGVRTRLRLLRMAIETGKILIWYRRY